jgi:hypothetical protein
VSQNVPVGGVNLGPTTDFVSLFRRQMLEGSVWSVFRDQSPQEGLEMAFHAVIGTPLEPAAVEAIMQLLTDPDVTVRTRAIGLAKGFSSRFDSGRLLSTMKQHPRLYDGVKPHGDTADPDLAWGLLEAMLGHPTATPEVRERLRQAALSPREGSRVMAAMTRADPDWVLEHAAELASGDPLNLRIIILNLPNIQAREQFVRSLKGLERGVRASARSAISDAIKDPSERTHLERLLG